MKGGVYQKVRFHPVHHKAREKDLGIETLAVEGHENGSLPDKLDEAG